MGENNVDGRQKVNAPPLFADNIDRSGSFCKTVSPRLYFLFYPFYRVAGLFAVDAPDKRSRALADEPIFSR